MKKFTMPLAVLLFSAAIILSGCQSHQGMFGQGYGGGPGYQPTYQGAPQQPGLSGGVQRFGQDFGRRFANGFLNRAVYGVVNLAWRAIGL